MNTTFIEFVAMTPDDVYRPPAIEPTANHSTFTHDEWRYMGKVFVRSLFNVRGWLILRFIIMAQMLGLSLYVVRSAWNTIFSLS